jgi:hypothetical protein
MNYRGRFWVQKEKSKIFVFSWIQRAGAGPRHRSACLPEPFAAAAWLLHARGGGRATALATR